MGGQLSCMQSAGKHETPGKTEARPSQYEEIDDNFTIIPEKDNSKSNGANGLSSAANETTTNTDVGLYQNVIISPGRQDKNSSNSVGHNVHEIQKYPPLHKNSPAYPATQSTSANEIHTANQNSNGVSSSYSEVIVSQSSPTYQNVTKQPQWTPVVVNGSKNSQDGADENLGDLYTKVVKPSRANGYAMAGKTTGSPANKPELVPRIKESHVTTGVKATTKSDQLNYIEVEFTSPLPAKRVEPSTTYTDVVNEGGRLVLIN